MRKETRLILALDETDREKALRIADVLKDVVDAIKINYPITLALGTDIITELSKLSDVICDYKVADVPHINKLIAEHAFEKGASGIICHGFVGRDSIEACIEAAEGKDVFVLTEMSHPGGKEFTQPISNKLAELAVETGATGVIAPATRPDRIKEVRKIVGDLLILSPGVGAQGGSARQTIKAGADYIIVGRSIYHAEKPRECALGIIKEMEGL